MQEQTKILIDEKRNATLANAEFDSIMNELTSQEIKVTGVQK